MIKYAVDTQKRGPKLKKLTIERRNELFDDCWYSEERALRRFAKEEFGKLIIKSPRRVKIPPKLRPKRGRRPYIKISKWLSKLKKKYRHTYGHNQIYVFSNDEKCIYVGRTTRSMRGGGGKWRASYYRKSKYIQFFIVKNERNLAKAECLAVHIYQPTENRCKPSSKKYWATCPVHERLDAVYYNLKDFAKLLRHRYRTSY